MKKILAIVMMTLISLTIVSCKKSEPRTVDRETNVKNVNSSDSDYTSTLNKWREEKLRDDFDYSEVISPLNFNYTTGELLSDNKKYDEFITKYDLDKDNTSHIFDFSNADEITININVEEEGLYTLALDYFSVNKTIRDMEIAVYVNDSVQYFEAGQLALKSNWVASNTFNVDRYGNDIMPNAKIEEMWVHTEIRDTQRVQKEALKFHLLSGDNTIKVKRLRGEFYLGQIYVYGKKQLLTYDEYLNKYQGQQTITEFLQVIEAENPLYKNDLSVRYGTDRATTVTPFALMENKLNMVDGAAYDTSGHSLTYNVDVLEAGFYYITVKAKQGKSNTRVFRTLYVNGFVPFEEAKEIPFDYSSKWKNVTLESSEGKELKVYLNKGINEITLEVNSSPLLEIYETIDYVMKNVNELGLDIKKLTGNNVDPNRDWEIEKNIPNIKEDLERYANLLYVAYEDFVNINKTKKTSEITVNLLRAAETLDYFAANPNRIPKEINRLSVGNNSVLQKLGLILPIILEQPLSMDKIFVHGEDSKLPGPGGNFFNNIWVGIRRFFLSFFDKKYNDKAEDDELEVWVNRSRQYVNLMQQMVDDTFTKDTGIKVKISIMPNEDKLILATSSDTQPDVALGVAGWRPYDFAVRNALVDLREMPGFFDVAERFKEGAFAQLIYQDGVYGLPETQNFSLLFYRKDILDNIGVEIPNTWQDVIDLLPEIQRYGLNFYNLLSTSSAFKAYLTTMPFINQFGGRLYSDDILKSNLTDSNTIKAIDFMTELYTIYSLPLEVGSFYNQFRYGNLPLGIGDFGMYVQLLHAAPEIAGLWDIAPMPGVLREDGTVDRTYDGSATSGMIFKNSDKVDEGWKFLDWWTSKDVQLNYAENLITSLGSEYMWNTSNVLAFEEMTWDDNHKEAFLDQWEWIFDTPKTPASYMMERELSNIWNKIVYDGENTRIAISDSAILIDKEITKKMIEFKFINNRGEVLKNFRFPTKETIHEWVRP
ncbi:extracellular solute-binding protein [Haploplasma axanthum]|nr:extracellular solute-binding protein [Haploplasma axanthum]